MADPEGERASSRFANLFTREALLAAIVTGVAASAIFGIFIEPITNATRSALLHVAGQAGKTLVDSTYRLAVKGPEDEALQVLVSIVLWSFSGLPVWLWLSASGNHTRARRLRDSLGKPTPSPDAAAVEKRVNQIIGETRRTVILTAILVILIGIGTYTEFFRVNAALDIRSNYNLNMMSLASYSTEAERAQLTGLWARVRNRADFQRLFARMTAVAAAHKQTLAVTDLS
jgi:hypothetical protein